MLESLIEFDKELLLIINSWNAPWLDKIMMGLTNGLSWLPLFIFVLGLIIYKFRMDAFTIIIYLILVIVLADQISASLLKPMIGRLRPSHDPEIREIVHIVNDYRGGMYSFVSSHAANAFGVATFLFLAVRNRIRWIWVMFVWATVFTYTRLYLGVHYPLDIICGGLLGALLAFSVIWLSRLLPPTLQLKP